MIANVHAYGRYSILEEGEIDAATLQFNIAHYLVCDPQGCALDAEFLSIAAAQAFIDNLNH